MKYAILWYINVHHRVLAKMIILVDIKYAVEVLIVQFLKIINI